MRGSKDRAAVFPGTILALAAIVAGCADSHPAQVEDGARVQPRATHDGAGRSPGRLPGATPDRTGSAAATTRLRHGPRYELNLYRQGDFVRQYTSEWCVGASIQIARNIIRPGKDDSITRQRSYWRLASRLSFSPNGGANPVGWARALNKLGLGPYDLVNIEGYADALRTAARAIRETRRPVGLVMWRGFHAWVMTGFRSRGDPLVNAAFEVTDVRVLDPLYPTSSRVWGASARPNARLTPRQLARTFMPRNRPPPDYARPNSYVLVLPRPTETFIRPGSSPGRR